jgi:copper chaperone CopZ
MFRSDFGRSSARLLSVLTLATASLVGCATSGHQTEKAINHENVTLEERRAAGSREPVTGGGAFLFVKGLGCPQCAHNIHRQLQRIRGVDKIDVDLSVGIVSVSFEGDEHPSPYILGEAINDAGFTLVKVTPKQ